jgi:late competence protein required for DNA uptake (superfamily II DNA/RNA helicase)
MLMRCRRCNNYFIKSYSSQIYCAYCLIFLDCLRKIEKVRKNEKSQNSIQK